MKGVKVTAMLIIVLIVLSCTDSKNLPDAYGQFEATEIILSSEVQGKLVKWDVEEGKFYPSQQLLGIIDTNSLFLKKQQLIAQQKQISAKYLNISTQIGILQQQKANFESEKVRFEKLVSQNAATLKQLDDIVYNIKVIEKQIENAKTQNNLITNELESIIFQIKQLDDQLSKCYIRMPIDGSIIEKYVEPFELALPNKPLLKIADLSQMFLRCYIDEEQLSQFKLGQNVKVFVDRKRGLKEYSGTVTWISSQAEFSPKIIQNRDERKNLVYAVKILVKNDGSLKIGMLGDIIIK
ncbi:MAG TPA: HlyD family efflux transporter periplasmic adaptor subunit [Candidatus Kapabacteria bacterium]|jgi:HlyD family secretion protein|nr:HlyD family efflux transporter periplasmic adaptor subunit [Candidatus Kapabacteria bacterium]